MKIQGEGIAPETYYTFEHLICQNCGEKYCASVPIKNQRTDREHIAGMRCKKCGESTNSLKEKEKK